MYLHVKTYGENKGFTLSGASAKVHLDKLNQRERERETNMFIIIATKPLNDRTKGFRFNVLGLKGLTRKRKNLSRGWKVELKACTMALHLGKRTVYVEHRGNRSSSRFIRHFAG